MKKKFLALFILFFLLNPSSSRAVDDKALPSGIAQSDIGHHIEAFVAQHEDTTAGMAVAIFNGEGLLYENVFGFADIEGSLPVSYDTVFEWGSCSKLLVWVSAMQLWEKGDLDLNADIDTYLPDGFLKNRSYDAPITMIDLMNHSAGFQEILENLFVEPGTPTKPLGEVLTSPQPPQIFEPSTVAGYSNWGTSLAGYVIECISGMPFDAYVQKNIFQPLGMDHTSISSDLSDNPWVAQQRELLQCYTADRKLIPHCFYFIPYYPAGSATGTLQDFSTFGRALIPAEGKTSPLFKKEGTLEKFFEPTAYYGDSGVGSNSHGLWTLMYRVPLLGHGGNTAGNSSVLLFDAASGIGTVVMTNQANETIYNWDMMELIFGKFSDSPYADYNKEVPSGFFRSARTFTKGPLSLLKAPILPMFPSDLDSFWVASSVKGMEKVVHPFSDQLKVSLPETIFTLLLNANFLLGTLYSLVTLLVGGLILLPMRRRKQFSSSLSHPLQKWNYIACLLQVLMATNLALLAVKLLEFRLNSSSNWQFTAFIILGVLMGAVLFLLTSRERSSSLSKKESMKYGVTKLMLVLSVITILYYQLYMFWWF